MRKFFIVAFLCCGWLTTMAQVDSTLAVIDTQAVRAAVIERSGIDTLLTALEAQYKEQYDKMQQTYNMKVRDYIRDNANLDDAVKLAWQTEITQAEQRIALYVKRYKEDVAARRENLLLPLEQKIEEAIDNIVLKYNIRILLEKSAIVRQDATVRDITEQVIDSIEL